MCKQTCVNPEEDSGKLHVSVVVELWIEALAGLCQVGRREEGRPRQGPAQSQL